ncbi:MAG: phage portal protein [Ketobacter sp.]|nr:phage portal protein [Ketobacter sp.]
MVLQQLAAEIDEEAGKIRFYRDLYDGLIGAKLNRRQQIILGGDNNPTDGADFVQNFVQMVVDIPAERMIVDGFTFTGDDALNGDEGKPALWWEQNRMDGTQLDVHISNRRDGYTYVLVSWDEDNGRPEFTHELAFDDTYDGVRVHYNPENKKEVIAATKRWTTRDEEGNTVYRRNIYYPHLITKEINKAGVGGRNESQWQPYIEEGDDVAKDETTGKYIGINWLDKDNQPLGVPIIAFNNRASGYSQGVSAVENARGAQYAKNKADIDLVAAADAAGFPMYTLHGDSFPKGGDEDANDSDPPTFGPGEALSFPNENSKFGKVEPSNLTDLRETSLHWLSQLFILSRISPSYAHIAKTVQSAEGQQGNEMSMLSMIRANAVDVGNSWEDVIRMGLKLDNVFGDGKHNLSDITVSTIWKDFEVRNEMKRKKEMAETAQLLIAADANPYAAYLVSGFSEDEAERLAASGFVLDGENEA